MSNTKNKAKSVILIALGSVALVATGFITGTAISSAKYERTLEHDYVYYTSYYATIDKYKDAVSQLSDERAQYADECGFWRAAYRNTVDEGTYDKTRDEIEQKLAN